MSQNSNESRCESARAPDGGSARAADRDRFVSDLVAWINRRLAPPGVTVAAGTPLFSGGLIDSIRILELIAWTESAIGREIPDEWIRMDYFGTPGTIADVFHAAGTRAMP
ncbi:MAG TPA: hypothetical protein VMM18_13795 [Gemmatimonadaceae bacterium]|nr:hypothetical protein [Gemmatimonadaceae bacterium]